MGIRVKTRGSFKNTELLLKRASTFNPMPILQRYGEIGVEELKKATPVRTGLTRDNWYYEIEEKNGQYVLHWNNSNIQNGQSVVILLVMGHGNKNRSWTAPNDFVTPAMKKVFDRISIDIGREVTGRA